MNRIFTFGCSFTNYYWPTWADIIGHGLDHDQYQNWGRSGAGNQFIFNSIVECHARNCIDTNDTVVVMWTNVGREDRYLNGEWQTPGNIYSQSLYDKDFVRRFADMRGYYIRDLATMQAVHLILDNIGCNYYFLNMVEITTHDQYKNFNNTEQISDLLETYRDTVKIMRPSIHQIVFQGDWYNRPNRVWLENDVVNKLDSVIKWNTFYNGVRAETWPDCFSADDFENLPDLIKQECIEVFGYKQDQTKKNKSTDKPIIHNSRLDLHPTPAEHMLYLDNVLPEIKLTPETRKWVNDVELLIHCNQDYTTLWTPTNFPRRW